MPSLSDLNIEASYHRDIEDIARRIEHECIDFLQKAPKGIYSVNKVNPVMVDGIEYYTKNRKEGKVVKTVITSLDNISECVYTDSLSSKDGNSEGIDKLVIPKAFMLNKEKYLSAEPILPYRGIKIVKDLFITQVDKFTKYRKSSKHFEDIVQNNLIEMNSDTLDEITCNIKNIFGSAEEELFSFLGKFDWNLYFINVKETEIKIERSIDWRAYEYMQRIESGEWS